MSDNETRARESIAAFDASDWQAIRSMAGESFHYDETGTGRSFSDATGQIERLVCDGDTVVMEIRWRGTHTGPLATPEGPFPASGRTIDVWATMWQRWEDGRLGAERHHLDMLTMMAQLGLVPAPSH